MSHVTLEESKPSHMVSKLNRSLFTVPPSLSSFQFFLSPSLDYLVPRTTTLVPQLAYLVTDPPLPCVTVMPTAQLPVSFQFAVAPRFLSLINYIHFSLAFADCPPCLLVSSSSPSSLLSLSLSTSSLPRHVLLFNPSFSVIAYPPLTARLHRFVLSIVSVSSTSSSHASGDYSQCYFISVFHFSFFPPSSNDLRSPLNHVSPSMVLHPRHR